MQSRLSFRIRFHPRIIISIPSFKGAFVGVSW
jgi:hypothetical protein